MRKYIVPWLIAVVALGALGAAQTRPVTITYSQWGSPEEAELTRQILDVFMRENPGIRVNFNHIPSAGDYLQSIQTLIAGGGMPDVFFINNIDFPTLASRNVFLDLEPFLARSDKVRRTDFFGALLQAFTWDGRQRVLPRDVSNLVMFYNKDLFRAAGVPFPTSDWTWDDYLAKAQALTRDTNGDGNKDQWGTSFPTFYLFWQPFVWSNGGSWLTEDKRQFRLNSPESVEGLQWYVDLRWRHGVAPTPAEAQDRGPFTMFRTGLIGMHIDGRWRVPALRPVAFDWDVVLFPRGKAGSIVDVDGSAWGIWRETRNAEAAWRLVEFFASADTIRKYTERGLIIPSRSDIGRSAAFLNPKERPANADAFISANHGGRPTETFVAWNEVVAAVNRAMAPVWSGDQRSVRAALDAIAPEIRQILERAAQRGR